MQWYVHSTSPSNGSPSPRARQCQGSPHCFFLSFSRFASARSSAIATQTKAMRTRFAITAATTPAGVVFFSIDATSALVQDAAGTGARGELTTKDVIARNVVRADGEDDHRDGEDAELDKDATLEAEEL